MAAETTEEQNTRVLTSAQEDQVIPLLRMAGLRANTVLVDGGQWQHVLAMDVPEAEQADLELQAHYLIEQVGDRVRVNIVNSHENVSQTTTIAADGQVIEEEQRIDPATRNALFDQIREQKWDSAGRRSYATWRNADWATDEHEYARRKNIETAGLKTDQYGNLVIPLRSLDGRINNIQRIAPDGTKKFSRGGRVNGQFAAIGDDALESGKPLVLVEGYATGASVWETTGLPVIATMNAKNLRVVATTIRDAYPDRELIIAGDNDHRKTGADNVGATAAADTADAVGATVVLPPFEAEDHGTDWNDWLASRGPEQLRQEFEARVPSLRPVKLIDHRATRTYLNYGYNERAQAREAGAHYDPNAKAYYLTHTQPVPAAVRSRIIGTPNLGNAPQPTTPSTTSNTGTANTGSTGVTTSTGDPARVVDLAGMGKMPVQPSQVAGLGAVVREHNEWLHDQGDPRAATTHDWYGLAGQIDQFATSSAPGDQLSLSALQLEHLDSSITTTRVRLGEERFTATFGEITDVGDWLADNREQRTAALIAPKLTRLPQAATGYWNTAFTLEAEQGVRDAWQERINAHTGEPEPVVLGEHIQEGKTEFSRRELHVASEPLFAQNVERGASNLDLLSNEQLEELGRQIASVINRREYPEPPQRHPEVWLPELRMSADEQAEYAVWLRDQAAQQEGMTPLGTPRRLDLQERWLKLADKLDADRLMRSPGAVAYHEPSEISGLLSGQESLNGPDAIMHFTHTELEDLRQVASFEPERDVYRQAVENQAALYVFERDYQSDASRIPAGTSVQEALQPAINHHLSRHQQALTLSPAARTELAAYLRNFYRVEADGDVWYQDHEASAALEQGATSLTALQIEDVAVALRSGVAENRVSAELAEALPAIEQLSRTDGSNRFPDRVTLETPGAQTTTPESTGVAPELVREQPREEAALAMTGGQRAQLQQFLANEYNQGASVDHFGLVEALENQSVLDSQQAEYLSGALETAAQSGRYPDLVDLNDQAQARSFTTLSIGEPDASAPSGPERDISWIPARDREQLADMLAQFEDYRARDQLDPGIADEEAMADAQYDPTMSDDMVQERGRAAAASAERFNTDLVYALDEIRSAAEKVRGGAPTLTEGEMHEVYMAVDTAGYELDAAGLRERAIETPSVQAQQPTPTEPNAINQEPAQDVAEEPSHGNSAQLVDLEITPGMREEILNHMRNEYRRSWEEIDPHDEFKPQDVPDSRLYENYDTIHAVQAGATQFTGDEVATITHALGHWETSADVEQLRSALIQANQNLDGAHRIVHVEKLAPAAEEPDKTTETARPQLVTGTIEQPPAIKRAGGRSWMEIGLKDEQDQDVTVRLNPATDEQLINNIMASKFTKDTRLTVAGDVHTQAGKTYLDSPSNVSVDLAATRVQTRTPKKPTRAPSTPAPNVQRESSRSYDIGR